MPRMSEDEARELVAAFADAKDGEELKGLVARNIDRCDEVFFAVLNAVIAQMREQGAEGDAAKLRSLGDYLASLRLLI